jgi:glycosyltransferase involved in cell wall biosynthesis
MLEHTFIIPCYKDSSFLEDCVNSLLNQTQKSNILITTSTPSEHISNIAAKYDIPVIINENPQGIASDWNFALQSCKTRYCTLAHQDDIYMPLYAEKVLESINKKPESLIAFCDYEEVRDNSYKRWPLYIAVKRILLTPFYLKNCWESRLVKKMILSLGCSICCPSVTFNLDNLKGFKFSSEYTVNLDWNAWLEMAGKDGAFCYTPAVLMKHRISSECETSKGLGENRRQEEDKQMFMRLWPAIIAKVLVKAYSLSYITQKEK